MGIRRRPRLWGHWRKGPFHLTIAHPLYGYRGVELFNKGKYAGIVINRLVLSVKVR